MDKGICYLSVIPLRETPSDKSQMTSQLLFGETVEIDDHFRNWYFVKNSSDGYQGWIDKKQIKPLSDIEFERYQGAGKQVVVSETATAVNTQGEKLLLSFGSVIVQPSGKETNPFSVKIKNGETSKREKLNAQQLIKLAMMFKNVPYLWGGRSFFGVDCSGFTQLLFMTAGYDLARDSKQQVKQGKDIYLMEEALPGDLIFFGDEENEITHVGLYLGNGKIIHASGKVRTDNVDHYGIYSNDMENYTHKLRAIQRIL